MQIVSILITFISYIILFIIGSCFGSFLYCLSWRIVHGESVAKGRSHCDSCGHVLGVSDLIPIVSFVSHRGRCKWCGVKLSYLHLVGEIISGLVFVSLYWRYGFSFQGIEYLLLACILFGCSFADLEGYIIPDGYLLAGIAVRIIFILLSENIIDELLFSVAGGLLVSGIILVVVLLFEKFSGKEAMGGGDIKLLFLTGLYFGWAQNILCVFFASLFGILFAVFSGKLQETNSERKLIPFGPSIALGGWVVMLFGEFIVDTYLDLFL